MESLLSDAVVTDLYPVCDYWQLVTDGPVITINNPIEISYMNKVYIRQRLRYYRTLDIADEPCT